MAARPPRSEYLTWERLAWARRAPSTVAFSLLLVVGAAVRVLLLRSVFGQQNSDTSVVYLGARHVMNGDLSVFYWGQNYGGTLFQLTAGELFRLIGPSLTALQIVEIGYWLAACLLLRSIVAKACGVVAGDVAGSLFWVASPYVVVMSFSDPGFYGSGVMVGLAAFRVAQGARNPPGWRASGAMGICLGLAFWTTPMAIAIAAPAAVWFVLRLRSLRCALVAAAGFVLGASPWLWANLHTNFASLHPLPGDNETASARYVHVFTRVVPGFFGYAPTSFSGRLATAAFLLLPPIGAAVALRRRNVAAGLLCFSGVLMPAVVALSGTSPVTAAGRYAAFMVPATAGAVGWAVGKRQVLALLAIVFVAGLTGQRVWDQTGGLRPVRDAAVGTPTVVLAGYLEDHRVSAVWADYWEAYLLSAATQERVTAAALGFPRQPSYEEAAMRPRHTTVVVFAGGANDKTLMSQRRSLPTSRRVLVGSFAVWTFDGRVDASTFLTAIVG